jgi:protein SCO1/2
MRRLLRARLCAGAFLAALWLAQRDARAAPGATASDTVTAVVAGSARRFPNPILVTHDGRRVRFYDDLVRGRTVMVNFSYTQCTGSCPRSTAQLVQVQRLLGKRFGNDVTLLTLSLDPENDSPEAMRRYITAHGGRQGWTWLTGRRDDIEAIRRFVGFTDRDPKIDANRAQHTTLVLLGNDRAGRWSSVPALIPAQQIVAALLRVSGERPTTPPKHACSAPADPHSVNVRETAASTEFNVEGRAWTSP